jgi:long-chain acyl-CoA synthetase
MRGSTDLSNHVTLTEVTDLKAVSELYDSLPLERAYYWEVARARRIFLTQPINGKTRNWTWAEAMMEARRAAAYLKVQNWEPGSRIVILARNCAWWIISELAIWMSGHVTVPIYTSLPVEAARRLIENCGPVACFIGALDNPELATAVTSSEMLCVRFPMAPSCKAVEWDDAVQQTPAIRNNPVRSADDLATIIYTSGTTGPPRGVMHSFTAFPYFARAVEQVVGEHSYHRVLSYLPLAHIAERAVTETAALYAGWRIFFSEGQASFLKDLKRAKPTLFFSVPRLYTKFQQGILARVPQDKLEHLLTIPVIAYFVRQRIKSGLGLGKVQFAASGSAPLAQELLLWFRKIGLPLTEGYGTTETGITHTALEGQSRPGFVGRAIPGVEAKIAPNGELLLRSPMNMFGYYNDPDASKELMTEDGFLKTGDLGEIDQDGWLKIRGRLKEQFKTSKGKYVIPSPIESMLNEDTAVECSIVMGSGNSAPFAVISLSDSGRECAKNESGRRELEKCFGRILEETNRKLAPHERLAFLVLEPSKWTIERNFVTPTLKLKRSILEDYYTPMIGKWTSLDAPIVWNSES